MHEKDEMCYTFLLLFISGTFPVLSLTEQPVSLVQNGMYCCDCATHDKCQQLDGVLVNGLPKGLL